MKKILLLLGLTFYLVWHGAQGLYIALRNTSKIEITYAEYLKKAPQKEWLSISECRLNFLACAIQKNVSGSITLAYIPIMSTDSNATEEKAHIILKTKDMELLSFIEDLNSATSEEEAISIVSKNSELFTKLYTIEGVKQFGIDLDSDEKEDLNDILDNVAKGYIILDETKRPNLAPSIIMLFIGLLIPYFFFIHPGRKKNELPDVKKMEQA